MDKEMLTTLDCFLTMKNRIATIDDFLSNISETIFDKPVACITKKGQYILWDLFIQSAKNTLSSIYICSSNGCFADANVLIRKYRDDLFLYLFILEVLNNRKGLTDKEINDITNGEYDAEKFYKMVVTSMSIIQEGFRKDKNDKAVDAWFDNEAVSGKFKRVLSIENYLNYLNQNPEIQRCILEHDLGTVWENIRDRLNDYTHNNGSKFIRRNLLEYLNSEDVEDCVLRISQDVGFITSVFLVILILIRPSFIMASDYIDCLDVGVEPPEDSQYWVAPFIIEYIDEYIVKLHPELKAFLHNNNKYGMQII